MAWIFTIVKNLTLNMIRSGKYYASDDISEYNNLSDNFCTEEMVENRMLIKEALSHLNDTERQIVVLHVLSGMKHTEIAALFSKPYGTVLWTYSSAMKKLKRFLSK